MSLGKKPLLGSSLVLDSVQDLFVSIAGSLIAAAIWHRRRTIMSLTRRHVGTLTLASAFLGLAALVSSPIVVSGRIFQGNMLYGGTSTTIVSKVPYTTDLTFLSPFLILAAAGVVIIAVVSEVRKLKHMNGENMSQNQS